MDAEQDLTDIIAPAMPISNAFIRKAGEVVSAMSHEMTKLRGSLMVVAGAVAIGLILATSGSTSAQDQLPQVPYDNSCFKVISGDFPKSILDAACVEIKAKPIFPNCEIPQVDTTVEDDIQAAYKELVPDSQMKVSGFFGADGIHIQGLDGWPEFVQTGPKKSILVHEYAHAQQKVCRPELGGIPSASGKIETGTILKGATPVAKPYAESHGVCLRLEKPIQAVNKSYNAGAIVCIPTGVDEIEASLVTGDITGTRFNSYGTDDLFSGLGDLGIKVGYSQLREIITAGTNTNDFWEYVTSKLADLATSGPVDKERITQLFVTTMVERVPVEEAPKVWVYGDEKSALIYNPLNTGPTDQVINVTGHILTSRNGPDGKLTINLGGCPGINLGGQLTYADWVTYIKNPPTGIKPPVLPDQDKLVTVPEKAYCDQLKAKFSIR